MLCPACARPIATARPKCLYCGAPLSEETIQSATLAAERVQRGQGLSNLEAAAKGIGVHSARRYVVVDTAAVASEVLADACSVSVWEARQWQAASRFRLVKVSSEPPDGPLESGLRAKGLTPLIVPEEKVLRSRNPVLLESIDAAASPPQCSSRDAPESPLTRTDLKEQDLLLIVSASIKREKVKTQDTRVPTEKRLDDALLVHLHLRGADRPFEIDPLRTTYEGTGVASAYIRTLELARRLSSLAPHDESFRNVVPALSPGLDPSSELKALASSTRKKAKEPKIVILDNVAQFREYSAWRGGVEAVLRDLPGSPL